MHRVNVHPAIHFETHKRSEEQIGRGQVGPANSFEQERLAHRLPGASQMIEDCGMQLRIGHIGSLPALNAR
jgi:hypothetical protein